MEQVADRLAELRVGRFCDGVERAPALTSALRVGSFADGQRTV
jgi:hypothetical protein